MGLEFIQGLKFKESIGNDDLLSLERGEQIKMFRRKAKWIYWREKGIKQCKCSKCKVSYGCMDTPYCPNCGRKMVGAIKGKEV